METGPIDAFIDHRLFYCSNGNRTDAFIDVIDAFIDVIDVLPTKRVFIE
jgi:hypothetical protein